MPDEKTLPHDLRAFGPMGIAALIIIFAGNLIVVPLTAVLVLVWAHLSHTPLRELGFSKPKSWWRVFAIGISFGVFFKLVMKALVMPLFGAPPLNGTYHFIAGDASILPLMIFLSVVGAGFGEETFFRGFLFERMRTLLGSSRTTLIVTVLVTSALFAALHYPDQGINGVQQAAVTGVVFGTIYAVTNQLWIPMIAHAAFDVAAVMIIYMKWESAIAHLLFS